MTLFDPKNGPKIDQLLKTFSRKHSLFDDTKDLGIVKRGPKTRKMTILVYVFDTIFGRPIQFLTLFRVKT